MNKKIYTLVLLSFFIFQLPNAQTVTLSGKVLRHNGDPVEGVTVNCTDAASVITDAEGNFSFPDLPEGQNYTITGEYETDVYEGVTILDELFFKSLILAIITDSVEYNWLAGDVNESGSLGNLDIIYMRRAALRINNNFPDVYWKFFSKNIDNDILQNIDLINVTEDRNDLELIAVKLGDLAIDADHLSLPPDAPQPGYYIEDIIAAQDEEFSLEIKVNDFKQIVGFQHGLSWDTNVLEFVAFEDSNDINIGVNEAFVMDGEFLITSNVLNNWPEIYNLEDSATLYSIKFKTLQDLNSLEGLIDFSTEMIPQQTVYLEVDDDWSMYLLENNFEGVSTSVGNIIGLETFELAPNPAQKETFVNIIFNQVERAELTLYDLNGRWLKSWNVDSQTYQESISLWDLAPGTYILKLSSDKGAIAKKLVKY